MIDGGGGYHPAPVVKNNRKGKSPRLGDYLRLGIGLLFWPLGWWK